MRCNYDVIMVDSQALALGSLLQVEGVHLVTPVGQLSPQLSLQTLHLLDALTCGSQVKGHGSHNQLILCMTNIVFGL